MTTVALSTQGSTIATSQPSATTASKSSKTPSPSGSSTTDSALLWMVEQLDAANAVESSIGSLASKRLSGLIPNVTISLFDDEEDWVLDAELK